MTPSTRSICDRDVCSFLARADLVRCCFHRSLELPRDDSLDGLDGLTGSYTFGHLEAVRQRGGDV
jgi:hypothetical protein